MFVRVGLSLYVGRETVTYDGIKLVNRWIIFSFLLINPKWNSVFPMKMPFIVSIEMEQLLQINC